MQELWMLLALPTGLLTLTFSKGASSHELQWPHNLPRNVKYFPEDEPHMRRDLEAQKRIATEVPIGVKKMDDNPNEKFFVQFWDFGEQTTQPLGLDLGTDNCGDRRQQFDDQPGILANISKPSSLLSPSMPHSKHAWKRSKFLGSNVFARDFQCPAGTSSCSSISQSDLCCPSGETCVNTSDGVGCCPSGATCGDTVASCDTAAGYTSCPGSGSGGCCVPGAACLGSGCVFYGTQTVTTTLPLATVTTGTMSTSSSSSSPSDVTPQVIVSGYTTTATVTISGQEETQTTTVVIPTTILVSASSTLSSQSSCSAGFFTCPASLGGGCCANGQACAPGTQCSDIVSSTSTVTPSAPVRPTTVQPSSESSVSAADTTSYAGCPTGFYMCSAVYLGGCCRVDRNCDTMSCPASDSTDIVTSGVTIAAPTGAATTDTTGSCASGWYLCAASAGGGCCPSGYLCGASCSATISGVSDQPKETPSSANVDAVVWTFFLLSVGSAIAMIWL